MTEEKKKNILDPQKYGFSSKTQMFFLIGLLFFLALVIDYNIALVKNDILSWVDAEAPFDPQDLSDYEQRTGYIHMAWDAISLSVFLFVVFSLWLVFKPLAKSTYATKIIVIVFLSFSYGIGCYVFGSWITVSTITTVDGSMFMTKDQLLGKATPP